MDVQNFIGQVTSQALIVAILISLPAIIASLAVGLVVAIFSATTQIQEQTLSFAPKMVVVYVVIAATGSWVGGLMLSFARKCFTEFANVIS